MISEGLRKAVLFWGELWSGSLLPGLLGLFGRIKPISHILGSKPPNVDIHFLGDF
jgi:hypothetical protein